MSNITKLTFVLAFAALIVGLSACEQLLEILSDGDTDDLMDSQVPQLAGISGDIEVGLVLPLTGPLTESFGRAVGTGLELAVEEINDGQMGDARIVFITEDSQSAVEGAVQAYTKLIREDSVSVILGPSTSAMTRAAFPVAEQNQVAAISPTSAARGISALGDYVFRVSLATDVLVPNGINVTREKLDLQRVATLYDSADDFSVDSESALQEALAANGIKALATETFESGDTDFSNQLTRIAALNPDAVFVSCLPPERVPILTQARDAGIPVSVPIILYSLTLDVVKGAGAAAEGAMTFAAWTSANDIPKNQEFVENYTAKYGAVPGTYSARAYTAAYVLAEAIANAGSTESTAIRDALADISDLDTILGSFAFNEVGDAVYNPIVLIVENGELKIFE